VFRNHWAQSAVGSGAGITFRNIEQHNYFGSSIIGKGFPVWLNETLTTGAFNYCGNQATQHDFTAGGKLYQPKINPGLEFGINFPSLTFIYMLSNGITGNTNELLK